MVVKITHTRTCEENSGKNIFPYVNYLVVREKIYLITLQIVLLRKIKKGSKFIYFIK